MHSGGFLKGSPNPARKGKLEGTRAACTSLECLEDRVVPTSTLYLDYGDRFAGGILNTTVGAIDSTTFGPIRTSTAHN